MTLSQKKSTPLLLIICFLLLTSFIKAQPSAKNRIIEDIKLEKKLNATELILPDNFYNNWITTHVSMGRKDYNSIPEKSIFNLKEGGSEFVYPVKGQLYGGFCYRGRIVHSGVDIGLKRGTPVMSSFDGVVRMAKYYGGYGKIVVIRHLNGLETVYSHLSKIKVKVNQHVKAGDIIGLGGRTGRATANHLHYETRINGIAFDPGEMLDLQNFTLKSDTLVLTKVSFLPKYKIYRTRRGKVAYDLDYDEKGALIVPNSEKNISKLDSNSAIINDSNVIVNKKNVSNYSTKKYYKVRKGDNLGLIAKKNRTSINRLISLNGNSIKKRLSIGKVLRVS